MFDGHLHVTATSLGLVHAGRPRRECTV